MFSQALECRQWQKAGGIVEALDPNTAAPFYKRIARHYENARSFEDAERYVSKLANYQQPSPAK